MATYHGRQKADSIRADSKPITQSDLLRQSLNWVLNDKMFVNLRMHGNTTWTPRTLVALAVLTAWSEAQRMTDAFDKATKLSEAMFSQVAIRTFQGMMRALVTWTAQLLPLLWLRMHELMQQVGQKHSIVLANGCPWRSTGRVLPRRERKATSNRRRTQLFNPRRWQCTVVEEPRSCAYRQRDCLFVAGCCCTAS